MNERHDGELSSSYRDAIQQGSGGDRSECPAPEALQALVDGSLPQGERSPLVDHVMSCGDCLPEFELLRSISSASGEDAPQEHVPHQNAMAQDATAVRPISSGRRSSRGWLALAASIVGLVVAGSVIQSTRSTSPLRGGEEVVRIVAPVGQIDSPGPVTFTWTASVPNAEYEVEVMGPDDVVLLRSATSDTVFTAPASIPFEPGALYRWRLRVTSLDLGEQLLPAVEFSIR